MHLTLRCAMVDSEVGRASEVAVKRKPYMRLSFVLKSLYTGQCSE